MEGFSAAVMPMSTFPGYCAWSREMWNVLRQDAQKSCTDIVPLPHLYWREKARFDDMASMGPQTLRDYFWYVVRHKIGCTPHGIDTQRSVCMENGNTTAVSRSDRVHIK
jgi:hypothetical protein